MVQSILVRTFIPSFITPPHQPNVHFYFPPHVLMPMIPARASYSMKYSPSESGHFDGQRGYGYISIEKFIDAARGVNQGQNVPSEFDNHGLPTIRNTVLTTAILNAGRISLDEKRPVGIKKRGNQWVLE